MRIFVAEIKPSVRITIEENMVDIANLLAEFAARDMQGLPQGQPLSPAGNFAQAVAGFTKREVSAKIHSHEKDMLDLRIYATNDKGIVIFDSEGKDLGKDYSAWRDVYLTLRGKYGARSTREVPGDDTTTIYHVAAPIKQDQTIIGALTVAKPISTVSPIIDAAEHTILSQGAWLILGSLIIGIWVSTRLQRSVGRLVKFAQALAQGEAAPRPRSSTRELEQLASAMEKLRGQLDGKLYVESYVQALTHELKSPLTAMQAHAELLADEAPSSSSARRVLEQTQRMRVLVDQMLVLSRLESGSQIQLQSIDLRQLLNKLIAQKQVQAKQLGLSLEPQETTQQVHVKADPTLIELAIANLIQNAMDFSPLGGKVKCSLNVENDIAQITVQDQGPGLSDLAQGKLFERYFSTPRPYSGERSSGLGLALVKEIAKAHSGSIELFNQGFSLTQSGCLARLSLACEKVAPA